MCRAFAVREQWEAQRKGPPVVLDARVVTGTGGGPDKTILNSPRFLTPLGYRMLCAYLHPPGDRGFEQLRARATAWQAPLLSVPDRGPWDWQVVLQLLHICRRERVGIWHAHDYKSNALGLLLQRFWPMRLVTTVHGWVKETRRTPLYYWIDRVCLPHYEIVLCVSEDLCDRCLAVGVPADRCVLVVNGIDTAAYTRRVPVEEAKRRLGVPASRFVIGAVGRLSAEKGFDLLLRAAAQLLKAGRDLEVRLIGDGDQEQELRRLIAELGWPERMHLLGYRPDLVPLYEAMDVFVLSSVREGLPNVLLEALALEVPVVATRIAGVPRLIRDGQTGLLVEPGALSELTAALERLLGDAALRARLAAAGPALVETEFSFARRMERIARLYDGLLGRPRVADGNNLVASGGTMDSNEMSRPGDAAGRGKLSSVR
jgi:glycosyltransferase involved in cell wall biosynthesis